MNFIYTHIKFSNKYSYDPLFRICICEWRLFAFSLWLLENVVHGLHLAFRSAIRTQTARIDGEHKKLAHSKPNVCVRFVYISNFRDTIVTSG